MNNGERDLEAQASFSLSELEKAGLLASNHVQRHASRSSRLLRTQSCEDDCFDDCDDCSDDCGDDCISDCYDCDCVDD